MRAISLLSWWKFRNSMRTLFTDPRKLIPAIFLLLSLAVWIGGAALGANQAGPSKFMKPVDPELAGAAIFLILILDSFMVIDAGLGEGLLAFAMPDLDYLFPSPISRRIVLAYRLPALAFTTFFTTGLALYLIQLVGNMIPLRLGHSTAPAGTVPLAVLLSVGIWMNLALFVSVRIPDRRRWRKVEGYTLLTSVASLGLIYWLRDLNSVASVVVSPILKVIFFPCTLATNVVLAANAHTPLDNSIPWLFVLFLASLVPAFSSNANWYEQSIVSSERIAAIRTAAKGGMASAMAAQASRTKFKATKTYIVKPFGQGAMALLWAHLSAAAKRPWTNFVGPGLAGVALGAWGVITGVTNVEMSTALSLPMLIYAGMLFMGAAKTASEAAIRRRELLSPLPIAGWQAVAANLGVPIASAFILCLVAALIYMLGRGPEWPLVCLGIGVLFPLRLLSRMTLQYAQVLGFPDLADKIQQFLSQGIYFLLAAPLVVGEVIVCIPAILMQSWWAAMVALLLYEAGLLAILLPLAGRASDRAIATGEPVSIWKLVRKKI